MCLLPVRREGRVGVSHSVEEGRVGVGKVGICLRWRTVEVELSP